MGVRVLKIPEHLQKRRMSGTAVDVHKGTNKEGVQRHMGAGGETLLRIKAQRSVEKPSPRQPIRDAIQTYIRSLNLEPCMHLTLITLHGRGCCSTYSAQRSSWAVARHEVMGMWTVVRSVVMGMIRCAVRGDRSWEAEDGEGDGDLGWLD